MLFTNHTIGNIVVRNRMVMPPMTRSRAGANDVATDEMAKYYAQRASAGLMITEGTQISRQGQGYAWTPGIYSPAQVEGWRKVTDAVHREGGKIFAQLWHVGRVSHVSLQLGGAAPVAPSAILAEGVKVVIDATGEGPTGGGIRKEQHSMPRELTIPEIEAIVGDYAAAAKNAIEAGFDGVELHGANGYLIEQFIDSQTNRRTDKYGGSLENRLRFLKEVTTAVAAAIGKERVGVRQAPLTTLMGAQDDHPEVTYIAAARLLNEIGIAYIHIAEADWDDAPVMAPAFKEAYREAFKGTLIYSGKYNKERAEEALEKGWADMIGFGRPFIANPDLPYRMEHDLPLNTPDPSTFFGGTGKGYTDYARYQQPASVLA